MRNRVGVVIHCECAGKILLIHRMKLGEEYWVVPGGGLEDDESFEVAAKREVWEELVLIIDTMAELCTVAVDTSIQKYYISRLHSTPHFTIHGEELLRSSADNVYIPEWVAICVIDEINLLPLALKNELIRYFRSPDGGG